MIPKPMTPEEFAETERACLRSSCAPLFGGGHAPGRGAVLGSLVVLAVLHDHQDIVLVVQEAGKGFPAQLGPRDGAA